MIVHKGVGAYDHSGNWTWEFYPPPYDFLAPRNSAAQPAPILPAGLGSLGAPVGFNGLGYPVGFNGLGYPVGFNGLGSGACGCGGRCGCKGKGDCGSHAGMGLFESGLDWSQWGVGEWTMAGVGGYLAIKLFSDIMSGGRRVKRSISKSRRAREKKRKLQSQLDSL